jgi:hypothetical protein
VIHTRVIGESGSIGVPPCRLAAVEGSVTNRGHTFTDTDYAPEEQPFISGKVTGDPGAVIYILWPGH